MDSQEFDRRVELVEDALYELKNSGYAQAPDVSAIDAMLACTAELKVELYGMLVGWNKPAERRRIRFGIVDMILVALIAAIVTAIVAFAFYHY